MPVQLCMPVRLCMPVGLPSGHPGRELVLFLALSGTNQGFISPCRQA
jgi:hypothetical protein